MQQNNNKKTNMFLITLKRTCRSKTAFLGLIVVILVILIAIFAPLIAPYPYEEIDLYNKFQRPSAEHWFGTDDLGRDLFSRVIYGTRLSLLVGISGVAVSVVGGVVLGAIAGYFGKRVDSILMRLLDILQAVPPLLLAITIASALGSGIINCVLALSLSYIPGAARLMRSAILGIRDMEYLEAAESINCSPLRIIVHHVMPNATAPMLVYATMQVSVMIMMGASLSFVGLGVQPPEAEWGALLSGARTYALAYPYLVIFPGLALIILVLAINMFGDGLRDALDPKLKD